MRITVIALLLLLITGTGSAATYALTARPDSSVAQFNDGFRDSKTDDCQQGAAVACQWLHQTR